MDLNKAKQVYNISFLAAAAILLFLLLCRLEANLKASVDDIWGTSLDFPFFIMVTMEMLVAEFGVYYGLKCLAFRREEKISKVCLNIVIVLCALFVIIGLFAHV